MEKKSSHYKLNKKIKDDTFNVDLISSYNLSLQISPNLFRVCVTDAEKNRCLLLEDYQFTSIYISDQVIEKLEEIYDDHHILKAGFWKSVKLALKTSNFSLVPNSLFDKDFAKDYLGLNCALTPDDREEVLYYQQHSADMVNIFSADKKVTDWFIAAYPAKPVRIIHHTSPLIEGIMYNRNQPDEKSMFIHVEGSTLTILIAQDKALEFCNTFHFSTSEDFVYYVMFVAEQLKFNTESNPVTIWGDLQPGGDAYITLLKYVRNISFGNKPSSLYFGYPFDEVSDHSFFDLYSMHLCE